MAEKPRHKLGMMQGRVRPERLDAYQIFPSSAWRNELREIGSIGFDFVELLYDRRLECVSKMADAPPYDAKSVCADFLTSVSALTSPAAFVDALSEAIGWARGRGADVLVVPFFHENTLSSTADLRQVLGLLSEAGADEMAGDCALALEATLPAEGLLAAFDEHSFESVKLCYDLGNARFSNLRPEEELLVLDNLVGHIHVKDRSVNGPNVPLGTGDVDFEACFRSLDRIGYDGLLTLETHYGDSPADEAARNLRFIRSIQERTLSCAYSS
ncbi:MAG: sugar phosphate isomerase/epimerase [Planctomycetes bacterium]|nr:sugar phosphate isomerase/epimerase [Planctomycetota bacterium]